MTNLRINGQVHSVEATDDTPLLWVLRDLLGMTGTKFGCGIGQCGACTVHADGSAARSCLLPIGSIQDRAVTTIEAIGDTPEGAKIQKAWLDLEVVQCGYCQSGAALHSQITIDKGRVQQSNFNDYRMMRINEAPSIEVHLIPSEEAPGGIGEPGTVAAAPSLANALFAATGVRLRQLPIDRNVLAGEKPA
jgi:aerobic-type carbon monoxide dehydrogenase small subunit (CoxS/CutS family)